jgi:hypothetical protein
MTKETRRPRGLIFWIRRHRAWVGAIVVAVVFMDLWFFHIRPSSPSIWFPAIGFAIALGLGITVWLLSSSRR